MLLVLLVPPVLLASCVSHAIDASLVTPLTNDVVFAALDDMWSGVPAAVQAKREPSTATFNLALSYQDPCSPTGQRAYQGTIAGTKSGGAGTATLTMTATLTACEFDNSGTITKITATGVTVTGTVGITNDTWSDINLRMVATNVTVNGTLCPGGVDVMLTGTSPTQAISTGTVCGRTGAVPLP